MLIAVSGGSDSTALLAVLVELAVKLEIRLTAAHFHHGLRGSDSDRDEESAAAIAARFRLPFRSGRAVGLIPGGNLEARARVQRYAFLDRIAAEEGCDRIATGHTRDDQAETVLLRLLRGTGLDGLAGILPVRQGYIVRPLIDCSRPAILSYLNASGLPHRVDGSNDDRRFLRNRIRAEVLPLLQTINPRAQDALARVACSAAAERRLLARHYLRLLARARREGTALDVATLHSFSPAVRAGVLRRWLRSHLGSLEGITARHVEAAARMIDSPRPNGCVELPGGRRVERAYQVLRLSQEQAITPFPLELELRPGESIAAGAWQFDSRLAAPGAVTADPWTFHADAAVLGQDLRLRPCRYGDRIVPFGMSAPRKLQDVFVDRHVPRACRWGRPVLEAAGAVVWVPGVVRSSVAPVAPATVTSLVVVARRLSVAGP